MKVCAKCGRLLTRLTAVERNGRFYCPSCAAGQRVADAESFEERSRREQLDHMLRESY